MRVGVCTGSGIRVAREARPFPAGRLSFAATAVVGITLVFLCPAVAGLPSTAPPLVHTCCHMPIPPFEQGRGHCDGFPGGLVWCWLCCCLAVRSAR